MSDIYLCSGVEGLPRTSFRAWSRLAAFSQPALLVLKQGTHRSSCVSRKQSGVPRTEYYRKRTQRASPTSSAELVSIELRFTLHSSFLYGARQILGAGRAWTHHRHLGPWNDRNKGKEGAQPAAAHLGGSKAGSVLIAYFSWGAGSCVFVRGLIPYTLLRRVCFWVRERDPKSRARLVCSWNSDQWRCKYCLRGHEAHRLSASHISLFCGIYTYI